MAELTMADLRKATRHLNKWVKERDQSHLLWAASDAWWGAFGWASAYLEWRQFHDEATE